MRPVVFVGAAFVLLAVAAVYSLVVGPPVDPQANPVLGQREAFAALLGLGLLAFVAFGWDRFVDP